MKRVYLVLLCLLLLPDAQATMPSKSATYSCLAAQSVSASVKWRDISTKEINSEDDYKDGYDATYYIVVEGKEIGYAEKGESKAILYDRNIYPIDLAQALPGFEVRPTELNPFVAEWGMVMDAGSRYLCISFPFGVLGQSGSFQMNRSAFLIPVNGEHGRRTLFSASGNIGSSLSNAASVPEDVRAFIKQREGCEYFRGEIPDPSEKQRMQAVIRKINALCKGTDKALEELKRKYASNTTVMPQLNQYESKIEAHPKAHYSN